MASTPRTQNHTDSTTMGTLEIQTNKHAREFDLKIVRDAFINCIQPDDTLLLHEYIRAYEELCV